MKKTLKEMISIFIKVLDKIPEIRYAGDPVLRKQAKIVNISEGKTIGNRLGKILLQYRKITGIGRGLAAPQIGLNKLVFVTFIDNKLQTFINPKIIKKSIVTNFCRELCLSSGIMAADVERSEKITMEWIDEKGKKQSKEFDGFLARLYQHEEAHLRGKLNLDEAAEKGIEFALFDPLKETLREKTAKSN